MERDTASLVTGKKKGGRERWKQQKEKKMIGAEMRTLWTERWSMDGRTDGWVNRWMDGRMGTE